MHYFEKLNSWKLEIAIFIALLFHISGWIGMQTSSRDWFISNTPLNLCIMCGLLFWTIEKQRPEIYYYAIFCALVGFFVEVIGVNTGLLFGDYGYDHAMGIKVLGVPILIGIQWFVTVYCSGMTAVMLIEKAKIDSSSLIGKFLQICFAAALATAFDYILEPDAMALGYWHWNPNNQIPVFNYLCWFFISGFLLAPFFMIKSLNEPRHTFAPMLLAIMALFFLFTK